MDVREKVLYHQIHPFKLITDWSTAFVASILFWRHRLMVGLAVGLIPSIVVTALLVRWADLEPLERSAFGRYVRRNMTRRVEMVRLFGMAVVWVGAWYHVPIAIVLGVATILLAWASGWWRRPSSPITLGERGR